MQDSYKKNITTTNNSETVQGQPVVIQTDVGAMDGQNKCPRCGATEISLNVNTGKLKCSFCRCEFEPEKVQGMTEDISQLHGQIIGSGASDIIADVKDVMTFKCSSCGKTDKSCIEIAPAAVDAIKYITLAPAKKIFSFDLSEESLKEISLISKIYLKEKIEYI